MTYTIILRDDNRKQTLRTNVPEAIVNAARSEERQALPDGSSSWIEVIAEHY
jgi:hypothetical protein